jgi:hypothetical protein
MKTVIESEAAGVAKFMGSPGTVANDDRISPIATPVRAIEVAIGISRRWAASAKANREQAYQQQ